MKTYLLDTFSYNDLTNKKLLKKIMLLQQGIDPDFVDYIGTRHRKLS